MLGCTSHVVENGLHVPALDGYKTIFSKSIKIRGKKSTLRQKQWDTGRYSRSQEKRQTLGK